ncbi:MAG TPA: long-chain-acyl-CoA synthetase [Solimonas sp.]|nr:long-chain-acyl-CoA synthetase [Solimonas sp.]
MSDTDNRVHLRDMARGVISTLPDLVTVNKGLVKMALLRPNWRGSIGSVLEQHARRNPGRVALAFEDRRWSYGELNAWANRIAGALRARGVRPGDSVAILFENRPEMLACVAATVKLGAIAGMLNYNQRGEVLEHSIKLSKARVIIVGDECMEALQSSSYVPGQQQGFTWLWEGEGQSPAGYDDLRAVQASMPDDDPAETRDIVMKQPAFYIFTSGTTGLPKASVMSHYRWLNSMAGVGQTTLRLKPDDVFYCCLPLYHNNALTVSWGAAMGAGCTLALSRKFSVSRFWDEVRQYNATAFCYIGELCRYLLNRPASPADRSHRIRLAIGNGLRPEIWDEFQNRFGIERICEFYGASESNLAFINAFGLTKTAGFCPLTFAIVEFDPESEQPVRDRKGYMKKVASGGIGLLISEVTDRRPFEGYTDAKASEAKLFRNVFKKGDCWFNSGDLVRDQGWKHIAFVDRVGDTFRWKGENVATTEVEGALGRHPSVEHAVVYGVSIPGCDGRAGMAALTWTQGEFDGAGLAKLLCSDLPAYAVPLFLRLRPEQEVTGTFKYRKVDLKKQGFDPAQVDEPLYVLCDRAKGYEPVTAELFRRIAAGELRL